MKKNKVSDLLKQADNFSSKSSQLGKVSSTLEKKASELCKHPNKDIRFAFGDHSPSWVICMQCGYAEEGWGIGGIYLPSGFSFKNGEAIPTITMNVLMKNRRFFRTQRHIQHETICIKLHGISKNIDVWDCNGVCGR